MNRFFIYLVIQVSVVIGVTLSFKFIPDIQFAASVAGVLFLLSTLYILVKEIRQRSKKPSILLLNGVFFLFFCIPIFALHWIHYGTPLDQLSIFGVSGQLLHKWASPMMSLCILAAAFEGLRAKIRK